MNDFNFDTAIKYSNLSHLIQEKTVNLSIVVPPVQDFRNKGNRFLNFFSKLMNQVSFVTKPGGICCLVIDKKPTDATTFFTGEILKILEHEVKSEWHLREEIMWVKSEKTLAESINKLENGMMTSYDQIPFSHIRIYEKSGSELEYRDRFDRLASLKISSEKEAMEDSFWYVPPLPYSGYSDHLPREVLARLITLYSDKGDFVLDPIAGHGITGTVAKSLERRFLCLDSSEENVFRANERLKYC